MSPMKEASHSHSLVPLVALTIHAFVSPFNDNIRVYCSCEVKWKLFSHVRLFATPWTMQSMEFSRPEYWNGQPFPSPGDLPNPGIEPMSPTLQANSLPAEPQGKPKNTEVGSLSLLQRIFPTQELNRGLLHCRWILYQLSYEGGPRGTYSFWMMIKVISNVQCEGDKCWNAL